VQLAWRRTKAGSRPGARTDNAKLGLVIEGGGMRGVISAGSLMMLYELGLRSALAKRASALLSSFLLCRVASKRCLVHRHVPFNFTGATPAGVTSRR
jgi:hypothetical protein